MSIIAIMGGSFNPVHMGHIGIAKAAYEQFNMNKVLFMPSFNPSSYKDTSQLVSATHRCNMVNLAIEDYDYMELSTIEIERGGKTYTADTLKQLDGVYDYIYFIVGADSLFALDHWYKPDYVMASCHFLVANRDDYPDAVLLSKAHELKARFGARIDFINTKNIPISSSAIRANLASGTSVNGQVPAKVEEYIQQFHLYR